MTVFPKMSWAFVFIGCHDPHQHSGKMLLNLLKSTVSIYLVVGIDQVQLQQESILVFLHHLSDSVNNIFNAFSQSYPQLMGAKKIGCFFDSSLLRHLAVNLCIIFPTPIGLFITSM